MNKRKTNKNNTTLVITIPPERHSIKTPKYPYLKLPKKPEPQIKPNKKDYISIASFTSNSVIKAIANDNLSAFMKRKLRDNMRAYQKDMEQYNQSKIDYHKAVKKWEEDCICVKEKYKQDKKEYKRICIENDIKYAHNNILFDLKNIEALKAKLIKMLNV